MTRKANATSRVRGERTSLLRLMLLVIALSGAARQTGAPAGLPTMQQGALLPAIVARPVPVSDLTDVTDIAAGTFHSLALRKDGTVWAWGWNNHGQLGDGTRQNRSAPVQVTGLSDVTAIAGGYFHSLALKKDGTVWEWGRDCGISDGLSRPHPTHLAPVQIPELADVAAITSEGAENYALTKSGTVVVWGYGYNHMYNTDEDRPDGSPRLVRDLSDVIALSAGEHCALVLKRDGTVWAWGENQYGQLGRPRTTLFYEPLGPVPEIAGVVAISTCEHHTFVLKTDKTVWVWGSGNVNGFFGVGANEPRTSPMPVIGLENIAAVAAGGNVTLALNEEGVVFSWGWNHCGQLGDGTLLPNVTPRPVPTLTNVSSIAARHYHCLALKADGTVWEWGSLNPPSDSRILSLP